MLKMRILNVFAGRVLVRGEKIPKGVLSFW